MSEKPSGEAVLPEPASRWDNRVPRGTPIVGTDLQGREFHGLYGGEWVLDGVRVGESVLDDVRVVIVDYLGPISNADNVYGTFLTSDSVRLDSTSSKA